MKVALHRGDTCWRYISPTAFEGSRPERAKNDLKPHITKTFKFSNDLKFEEKFWDVIERCLLEPRRPDRHRPHRCVHVRSDILDLATGFLPSIAAKFLWLCWLF